MELILTIQEGKHIAPSFFNLNFGNWQEINVCEDCNLNIAENDHSFHEPCPNCGGSFTGFKSYTGKWDRKQKKWLKRGIVKINGKVKEQYGGFVI